VVDASSPVPGERLVYELEFHQFYELLIHLSSKVSRHKGLFVAHRALTRRYNEQGEERYSGCGQSFLYDIQLFLERKPIEFSANSRGALARRSEGVRNKS
jgi:hypothetical protein